MEGGEKPRNNSGKIRDVRWLQNLWVGAKGIHDVLYSISADLGFWD